MMFGASWTPPAEERRAVVAINRRREYLPGSRSCSPTLVPDSHQLSVEDQPLVGIRLRITKGDRPRTVYPPICLIDRTDWYAGEDRARIIRRARARDRHDYRRLPNLLLTAHGTALSGKRLTAISPRALPTPGSRAASTGCATPLRWSCWRAFNTRRVTIPISWTASRGSMASASPMGNDQRFDRRIRHPTATGHGRPAHGGLPA